MKRKDILVGGRYAVVKRMGNDGTIAKSVAATVVEMDVEYEARRWGTMHSRRVPMKDGIRVRFDEPMVVRHFDFMPLSTIEARGTLKAEAIEKLRDEAVTEYVLHGSKHVLDRQANVDEMRERWANENLARAKKIDAIGDVIEPVYEQVFYLLAVKSEDGEPECAIKVHTAQGTEKKRTTDATFTFSLDDIAKLLGVSVKP